ncbi:MAG: hypothetical protein DMG11_25150, partial [Acidobacteria bacterium]
IYDLNSQRATVDRLRQEVERKERDAQTVQVPTAEEQNRWAEQERRVNELLLPEQAVPLFFEEITRIANENGLERLGINTEETVLDPARSPAPDDVIPAGIGVRRYLVVTLKFQGDYQNVAGFLGGVSKLERPIEYRLVDIRRSPPKVDVTIGMKSRTLLGLLLISFVAAGSAVYQLSNRGQKSTIVTPATGSAVPSGAVSGSPAPSAVSTPEPVPAGTKPVTIPPNGWGRNPFLTVDEINKALEPPPLIAAAPPVERPVEPSPVPPYEVTAIISSANGSLAVVGDRIVQPGDKVGSETVKAITAHGVVLESGGRTRELPLKRFEDTVKKKETKQP